MHEVFFNYLSHFTSDSISAQERLLLNEALIPFKLRKRQYFLQEGNCCKHFAFIVKGAMRQYSVDDKGVEHIVRLGVENWWMGDRESSLLAQACISSDGLPPSVY
jgi:CRP-like cAMP-binding protein